MGPRKIDRRLIPSGTRDTASRSTAFPVFPGLASTEPSAQPSLDPSDPPKDGEDRLTKLPPELLKEIFSYLYDVDDDKWNGDKASLMALSHTNTIVRTAAAEDLFKCVTLKYSYDYDCERDIWMVPKLIRALESPTDLAKHVREIRLVVVPIPELLATDQGYAPRYFAPQDQFSDPAGHIKAWAGHLRHRLMDPDRNLSGPCVYQQDIFVPTCPYPCLHRGLEHAFNRLFDTIIHNATTREIFAYYIIRTLRKLLEQLPHLKHFEVGYWVRPKHLEDGVQHRAKHQSWRDYGLVRDYGFTFAMAVFFRTAHTQLSSIRIHGLPSKFRMYFDQELDPMDPLSGIMLRCLLDQVQSQMHLFTDHLTDLDLDIFHSYYFPTTHDDPDRESKQPMKYWSKMLQNFPNLRSLRLAYCGDTIETYMSNESLFGFLISLFVLPKLRKLKLVNWIVTPTVMVDSLPVCFPQLTVLDLEKVSLRSNLDNPWPAVVLAIVEQYGNMEIIRDGGGQRYKS